MKPAPKKRRRKARPAITEMVTVSTSTMSASTIERAKAPAMSPVRCCSNSASNQCSDTPFRGKVSPPFGPWNDRMKIADIGPYRNRTNSAKNAASA